MTKRSAHSFLPAELRTVVTVDMGRNKAKRIARLQHEAKRKIVTEYGWSHQRNWGRIKSRAPKLKSYYDYFGY